MRLCARRRYHYQTARRRRPKRSCGALGPIMNRHSAAEHNLAAKPPSAEAPLPSWLVALDLSPTIILSRRAWASNAHVTILAIIAGSASFLPVWPVQVGAVMRCASFRTARFAPAGAEVSEDGIVLPATSRHCHRIAFRRAILVCRRVAQAVAKPAKLTGDLIESWKLLG